MIRGLCDEEIREEVLAMGETKSLDETVKLIEAKEAGRRSAKHLGSSELASSGLNKLSAFKSRKKVDFKKDENSQRKCEYCNKKGHGAKPSESERKNVCSAWDQKCFQCDGKGHFKGALACKKATNNEITVREEICTLPSCEIRKVAVKEKHDKLSVKSPIPHMIDNGNGLIRSHPDKSPEVEIQLSVDLPSYEKLGLRGILARKSHGKGCRKNLVASVNLTADTGAQIDCVNVAQIG